DRPPLPPRPPRRGDHARGLVRPALGRLGRGREQAARAEGPARAAARLARRAERVPFGRVLGTVPRTCPKPPPKACGAGALSEARPKRPCPGDCPRDMSKTDGCQRERRASSSSTAATSTPREASST